jgi:Ser/Thr protein kinase RdoA (MazF antagonist)
VPDQIAPNHAPPGDVLGTPAPVLLPDQATTLLQHTWGLTASTVTPLASERDLNLLIDSRYVLKVSNPAEDPAVVDMENTAMAHALRTSPDLPIPTVVPATNGTTVVPATDATGRTCLARLITVLPGQSAEGKPITSELAAQIGALAARTSLALQGLFHRAGDRAIDWDVRRAPAVLAAPGVLDNLAQPCRRYADEHPGRPGRRHRAHRLRRYAPYGSRV